MTDHLLLFAAMGVVTYLPRWIPLYLLAGRHLPGIWVEWLELIPPAILSALIAPALLTAGSPRHFDFLTPDFLVALPTFAVAWKTRSLAVTVLTGMFLYWLAGLYLCQG